MQFESVPFGQLFACPQKNGLTRPKRVRGTGLPMVNMGELFAHPRIGHLEMDLVPVSSAEEEFLLASGDLLFARQSLVRDGAGQCSIFLGNTLPTVFESHLIRCRLSSAHAVPDFFFYFFRSPQGRVTIDAIIEQGAGAAGIRGSDLVRLQVPVPSLSHQQWVADVLRALDDRIDLLRQTNATLESIAQTLFKSWFIDFDPVRAKAEGREPEGMDAATAALFPAEFEESALGVSPKGWRVAAIRDVVADVYDGPHATPPEASEGPVFLGIKNLTGTSLDLGEVRHISKGDWAQWTRRVTPQPDDIVFSYEAALGLFALIPPGLTCCLGRRLALVRPMAEDGTPRFWFHQFIGEPFQRLLDKHTVHGATVNRIALKEFPSFTVMDPGNRLRIAFESVAQPLWARIHANRQQALNLAETRDTLLPRLISGKLRLAEARAQIEEAVTI